jgi:hypothetical protein
MRFEGRDLTSYAEPVSESSKLREGAEYFFVEYVDNEMLIPTVKAVVFVGRNLEAGDVEQVYFQDVESYREGLRYSSVANNANATFFAGSERELGHVFEFDKALDELMRCALRRGNRS